MNDALKGYVCAYNSEVTGSKHMLVLERPDGVRYHILIDMAISKNLRIVI